MRKAITLISLVVAALSLAVSVAAVILGWPAIKKYVPLVPKSHLRFVYEEMANGRAYALVIDNNGNAEAGYFKAEIKSHQDYSVKKGHSDFELHVSGLGGNWTTVTGRNILPGHKGAVVFLSVDGPMQLAEPKITSDSRYTYYGKMRVKAGPAQRTEP
jgi:hypothetical protein